jgi:DNA-binding CsgD family transcriptional regulator
VAPPSLTRREREVLSLIVRGFSSKKVAAKLGITFKTVATHRTHLMEKLGVHETASLVRIALTADLAGASAIPASAHKMNGSAAGLHSAQYPSQYPPQ